VKEEEANEQKKSIIGALKAAAPEWEFDRIHKIFLWNKVCRRARLVKPNRRRKDLFAND